MPRSLLPVSALLLALPLVGHAQNRQAYIVDWGHDWGAGWYRESPDKQAYPARKLADIDINGNGTTGDDLTHGWAYTLDETLSPTDTVYDYTLPSARFYGGAVVQVTDIPATGPDGKPARPRGATEGHINQNHELRDDWNLMAMPTIQREPNRERFAGALLCLWKKEDFLNGGSTVPVGFGPGDYIGVFVSRYWGGINWGRWIVREGDTFYVSKATFAGEDRQFDLETTGELNGARNPVVRSTNLIEPAATTWAVYDPKAPDAIFFNPAKAAFSARVFKDVTAVGFLAQRDLSQGRPVAGGLWNLPHGVGEPIALKFNAVQVVASISDPRPSPNLDLVPVGGSPAAPSLWAGRTEVTYAQWRDIWRWAVTNQRARNFPESHRSREITGYAFAADGTPGSAAAGHGTAHSINEPVTRISWLDAAIWCNALSEFEGLAPVYFEDAEFTRPARAVLDRSTWENLANRPTLHIKPNTDGYRLPSRDEWLHLAGAGRDGEIPAGPEFAWTSANAGMRTHAVAGLKANPFGLHDMIGNVAEYVWDGSPVVNPGSPVVAMGGSFQHPRDENAATMRAFAERPYEGTDSVGFRVVRNGPAPALRPAASGAVAPSRRLTPDLVLAPQKPVDLAKLAELARGVLKPVLVKGGANLPDHAYARKGFKEDFSGDLEVAAVETPYRLYTLVRQWAEAEKGYAFNYAGDIGSLHFTADATPAAPHEADEPVTNLAWVDAAVWCNALSELLGLEPAYLDKSGAPVRRANPFRNSMYYRYGYNNTGNYRDRPVDTASVIDWTVRPSSGGFRLPSVKEIEALASPGAGEAAGWFSANSGLRSHPVGTRAADQRGLFDIEGNVMEMAADASHLHGHSRAGNSFAYPAGAYPHKHNNQELPYVGRSYLGFRVVRTVP